MAVKRIHNERLFTDFIGVCKQVGGKLEALTDDDERITLSIEDAKNMKYDTYTCHTPHNEFTYSEHYEDVEKEGDAYIILGRPLRYKPLMRAQRIELIGNQILGEGYGDASRPRDPVEKTMDKLIQLAIFVE